MRDGLRDGTGILLCCCFAICCMCLKVAIVTKKQKHVCLITDTSALSQVDSEAH